MVIDDAYLRYWVLHGFDAANLCEWKIEGGTDLGNDIPFANWGGEAELVIIPSICGALVLDGM